MLNECGAASFTFVLGTTGLTRGNLSAHAAKLVGAGYVEESKQIAGRKVLTRIFHHRALRDHKEMLEKELLSGHPPSDPKKPMLPDSLSVLSLCSLCPPW